MVAFATIATTNFEPCKSILSTFTLLEELYQLNIPWKQVTYNTHNAYQAVTPVLHEFVTCVPRVN